jgi:predicted transcriptional regulator
MALHPTLWRTCRILAGKTRLQLLRQVVTGPGQTMSELAGSVKIGKSRASQELRRLQSRGLIQAHQQGGRVLFFPVSDPLVATAKPLLAAMKTAFTAVPPVPDEPAIAMATALSYPRRMDLLRELQHGPRRIAELRAVIQIPLISLRRHLRVMQGLDLVRQEHRAWHFTPNRHPLTRCLSQLIESENKKRHS